MLLAVAAPALAQDKPLDFNIGFGGPEKTILVGATPGAALTSSQLIESDQQMHVGILNLVYKSQNRELDACTRPGRFSSPSE